MARTNSKKRGEKVFVPLLEKKKKQRPDYFPQLQQVGRIGGKEKMARYNRWKKKRALSPRERKKEEKRTATKLRKRTKSRGKNAQGKKKGMNSDDPRRGKGADRKKEWNRERTKRTTSPNQKGGELSRQLTKYEKKKKRKSLRNN